METGLYYSKQNARPTTTITTTATTTTITTTTSTNRPLVSGRPNRGIKRSYHSMRTFAVAGQAVSSLRRRRRSDLSHQFTAQFTLRCR